MLSQTIPLTVLTVTYLFMSLSIFIFMPLITQDTPEISEIPELFKDLPDNLMEIYKYQRLNHNYNIRTMLNDSKLFFEFQPRVIILYNEIRAFHDMNFMNSFINIDYFAAYDFLSRFKDLYS